MSLQTQLTDPSTTVDNTELKAKIDTLKNDQNALKVFLNSEKDKLLQQIDDQKKITFDKVYGGLNDASQANLTIIALDQKNKQLNDIQQKVLGEQDKSAHHVTEDKNLAKRKYEMNEWSVQNKKETLFIYSMFLILLSGVVLLSALLNMGIISSYLFTMIVVPFIIIFLMVVIYRARLTSVYRDKRYWNRRTFDDKSGRLKIPTFAICPPSSTGSSEPSN